MQQQCIGVASSGYSLKLFVALIHMFFIFCFGTLPMPSLSLCQVYTRSCVFWSTNKTQTNSEVIYLLYIDVWLWVEISLEKDIDAWRLELTEKYVQRSFLLIFFFFLARISLQWLFTSRWRFTFVSLHSDPPAIEMIQSGEKVWISFPSSACLGLFLGL